MKIKSLGRRTDIMFAKFSGTVTDKGNYTVIQTPSNPGYHWGNYLIFDRAPIAGDLAKWVEIFEREFPYIDKLHHRLFTWDTGSDETGEVGEFIKADYELDTGVVLIASKVNPPQKVNTEIKIRKISTDEAWEAAIQNQTACAEPKYLNDYYESFKRKQFSSYRRMSEAKFGHWFGAYLNNQLVADLGVFYEGSVGRFQAVGTHPQFRRRGICGTLVYEAANIAYKEYGIDTLVMEADSDYYAAKIYESVGFKRNELNHALSWCGKLKKEN